MCSSDLVIDSEGNRYYEVDSLSQNVIYRAINNTNSDKEQTPYVVKPVSVPRRYTVEVDGNTNETYIQFGYGSDDRLQTLAVADPSEVVMQQYGKDYITDQTFDPYNLISTDKFGIAPSRTTLTVVYRYNGITNINSSINSINSIFNTVFTYENDNLSPVTKADVNGSIEVDNEEPILGNISVMNSDEIKINALSYFMTQNRAVTKQDYISLAYSMPAKFGAVKRVNISQDKDSFKRNLNMYVISMDENGFLIKTNDTTKNNLKNWINRKSTRLNSSH